MGTNTAKLFTALNISQASGRAMATKWNDLRWGKLLCTSFPDSVLENMNKWSDWHSSTCSIKSRDVSNILNYSKLFSFLYKVELMLLNSHLWHQTKLILKIRHTAAHCTFYSNQNTFKTFKHRTNCKNMTMKGDEYFRQSNVKDKYLAGDTFSISDQ